jgi:excisionase family DNA binding protein
VSRTFVYDLLATRQLPSTRIGGSLRVQRADVEAYEAAGTVDALPMPRRVRLAPPARRTTQRHRAREVSVTC